MHELSIAQNIVDILNEQLKPQERRRISSVSVRIGELSGVVPESLEFSFQVIAAESEFPSAVLQMELVPVSAKCNQCGKTSSLSYGVFFCPECGSGDVAILTGQELQVVAVDVNDSDGENT